MDPQRLGGLAIFATLDAHERQTLATVLQERNLQPGQPIFNQGDKAFSCFIILAGSIEVQGNVDEEGARKRHLANLEAGSLFGEVALLDGGRRSASCVAGRSGAFLAELRRPEFDMIFNSGNRFAYKLLDLVAAQLVGRLRSASGQLRQMVYQEATVGPPTVE